MNMKKRRLLIILSAIWVFASTNVNAQYGYYYDKGPKATNAHLRDQKGSQFVTQFTHFNFQYVSNRVHAMLAEQYRVPMEDFQQKKSGDYTVYSRRYKSEFSDDIKTDFYVCTEYTTAEVAGETVIVSARIYGWESYVGKFLQEFWKQMVASDKKSGEVLKFNFMEDQITVKLYEKDYVDLAELNITYSGQGTFAEYKKALSTFLTDFNDTRKNKVLKLADLENEKFVKNESAIQNTVITHFKNQTQQNAQFKGDFIVTVNVDTNGIVKLDVPSNAPGRDALLSKLNSVGLERYISRGYYFGTSDDYTFKVDFFYESGKIQSKSKDGNPKKLKVIEGSERLIAAARSSFPEINQGRGQYELGMMDFTLGNEKHGHDLKVQSYESEYSPVVLAAGTAVFLGGIGYAGYVIIREIF